MMTIIDKERQHWDAAATIDAEAAVWSEPNWDDGIAVCLDEIEWSLIDIAEVAKVLDLGCGVGRLALPIVTNHLTWHVTGYDISPQMLARAVRHPNITYIHSDGHTIVERDYFDVAYCVLVFQHLPRPIVINYIHEVAAALAVGGIFIFQYVPGDSATFLNHHFDGAEVDQWCAAAGLKVFSHRPGRRRPEWHWVTAVRRA